MTTRTILLASPRSFCAGVERAIEVVEQLGSEILLDMKVGEGVMVASVEPTVRVKVRDKLRVAIRPSRLHVFDAKTEAAI